MARTAVSTAVSGHQKQQNAADLIPSSGSPNALIGFESGSPIEFDWDAAAATPDSVAARDANGDLIVASTPTASDAATSKTYVDAAVQGVGNFKESVRVKTDTNLAATYSGGVLTGSLNEVFPTQDGVNLALNEYILVTDLDAPLDGSKFGIYELTTQGVDGVSPWALTRRADADSDADIDPGMAVWVNEGTTNGDTLWVLTSDDPFTLDTSVMTFAQVGALGGVTAGDGLTKTGSTLDVNDDDVTLTIITDTLQIKDAGVGTTQLADGAVTEAKTSFLEPDITLAGVSPVQADFSTLADGQHAFGVGTGGRVFLMRQEGTQEFAVELGEITS